MGLDMFQNGLGFENSILEQEWKKMKSEVRNMEKQLGIQTLKWNGQCSLKSKI